MMTLLILVEMCKIHPSVNYITALIILIYFLRYAICLSVYDHPVSSAIFECGFISENDLVFTITTGGYEMTVVTMTKTMTIRLHHLQDEGQLVPVEKGSSGPGKRTKAEVKVCHFCERKSKDGDWAIRSWVPSVSLYHVDGIYVNLCMTS